MKYNYDFWYQPRHNVMVSAEFGAPNAYYPGFKLEDVAAGRYGQRIHFWDLEQRKIAKTVDLGEDGLIPLEVRFHHDPDSSHGFVGAALSSNVYHWHKNGQGWELEKVIEGEPVEIPNFPVPLPPLITDILLSMDDRFMYFSNWLHGDLRQYDISRPGQAEADRPSLDRRHARQGAARSTAARSRAGRRCSSSRSTASGSTARPACSRRWDNQFYPQMDELGSCMLQIDCDTDKGGLKINPDFFVDFGKEPGGPARAHEMRYPGGDCTSDIWL